MFGVLIGFVVKWLAFIKSLWGERLRGCCNSFFSLSFSVILGKRELEDVG